MRLRYCDFTTSQIWLENAYSRQIYEIVIVTVWQLADIVTKHKWFGSNSNAIVATHSDHGNTNFV